MNFVIVITITVSENGRFFEQTFCLNKIKLSKHNKEIKV